MPKTPLRKQPPAPPSPAARSKLPIAIAAIVVVAVLAGAYAMMRSSAGPQADANAAPPTSTAQAPVDQASSSGVPSGEVPASAKFGPHKQDNYPPLPSTGYPPPRPIETVNAVYKFAAEHPEVLSYVPCYCGCDRQGHKGNDDCFVASRNASGDVDQWDGHGMT